GVRALATAVAAGPRAEPGRPPHAAGPRRGAGRDEHGVLPGGGPAPAVHGRRDRVPRHRDPGRRRGTDPAQRRGPPPHHGGRGGHHGDPRHRAAARVRLRLRELRAVHAVHRARPPDRQRGRPGGIGRLGAAMLVAAVVATPWGLGGALPAFGHPVLLLVGAGVGVCSSVIPYVTDQLAMARLARATFSLMLALLPVFATVIGAIVLRQLPTAQDVAGITLVVLGVALHKEQRKE